MLSDRWSISKEGHFLCPDCAGDTKLDMPAGEEYVRAYIDTLMPGKEPHGALLYGSAGYIEVMRSEQGYHIESTGIYGVDLDVYPA
jgi:hypothetical protein